jgi:hypothetical protein
MWTALDRCYFIKVLVYTVSDPKKHDYSIVISYKHLLPHEFSTSKYAYAGMYWVSTAKVCVCLCYLAVQTVGWDAHDVMTTVGDNELTDTSISGSRTMPRVVTFLVYPCTSIAGDLLIARD